MFLLEYGELSSQESGTFREVAFGGRDKCIHSTVKFVYKDHHMDQQNMVLYTGGLYMKV